MIRIPRLVRHHPDVALIDRVTAEVHVEFHFLLKHHDELPGLAVGAEKFLGIIQLVDVLPAAAGERFEEGRPADIGEHPFPIQRVSEVAKRIVIRVGRDLMGWEQHRFRHRDPDLRGERVVEKLFVGAPPKGVVDHGGPGQRRILEEAAIKRHVLRNPVDDDIVTARLALDDFVEADELGLDAFAAGFLVAALDEGGRETAFLSEEDSDFFHKSRVAR